METRPLNNAPATSSATPASGGISAPSTEKSGKAKKAGDAANAAAAKTGANKQDWGLDISPKAKEMSDAFKKATEIAHATPDVREDRVADIKKRLSDGTYEMDSGKIADGMMREAMIEHLANDER